MEAEHAIACRIREMLPKVRDDTLYADLAAMLKRHEDNIARAVAELA